MAITSDQIDKASSLIGEREIALWKVLFRKLPIYQQYAPVYRDEIPTRLAEVNGTVEGRILNAILIAIDELGVGEAEIKGDREGLHWSQEKERMALIQEGWDTLFEDSTLLIKPYNPGGRIYNGFISSGQRQIPQGFCPMCGSTLETYGGGCGCSTSRR